MAYEEPFGSLSADVALAGRDITLSRLLIEKPQPDGDGPHHGPRGSYNLDQRQLYADLQSHERPTARAERCPAGSGFAATCSWPPREPARCRRRPARRIVARCPGDRRPDRGRPATIGRRRRRGGAVWSSPRLPRTARRRSTRRRRASTSTRTRSSGFDAAVADDPQGARERCRSRRAADRSADAADRARLRATVDAAGNAGRARRRARRRRASTRSPDRGTGSRSASRARRVCAMRTSGSTSSGCSWPRATRRSS